MMNHEAKTKEQLIIELEELKQNYNSLKASYENDMAKSKQNEIDLQISEAQKKAILNGITSNIAFVDKDLKIIWANKTAANSVNKTPDEMIGKTCHHFWGDSSKPCENCPSLKAFDSKKSEHLLQYTPDGSIWDERGEPVFDVDGNMIGVVEIATNITEYKKSEKEKEQVQKLLEDTQKIGKIGGWEFDIDSMELKWTREMYQIHEVDPTFNPTTNHRVNFYSPESLTIIDKAVQRAIEFGEPYEVDLEIITAKGNKRSIKTIGKPDLENRRIFGLFQDITDYKKAEAALAQSRSELKAIYDLSPVMMCLVNDKRKIIFANRAFTNLTGTDEILLQGGHACGVFGCINATDDSRGCGFGAKCRNCSLRIAMDDTLKNGTGHLNVEYHTTLVQNGETREVSLLGSTALIESNEQRNLLLCLIDITERKKAEELLQKSQINLKNAQHLAQLGSWEWDMMSNMFTFSDEFYQIFGLNTEKQVINVDLLIDYIHPDDKEFYIGKLAKCLRTGESESFEYRIVRPDGEIRYLYASGNVIFDENNKPVKGTGVIQDITKRKKGVEALRESEKKYRLLTENTADVIWMLNLTTGKFTYVSPSVFQLRGYTAEEAMNERLEDSLTPDSIEIVKNAIEKDVEIFLANPGLTNSSFNEIQQYCKNGKVIWVEVSTQFQFASSGDIEVLGVSRNIEERKKAENALRASEEKFKAIIDTSPDGIAITALDGTIEFVTEKIVSMWGYDSADEIIGKNTMEFIDSSYHEKADYLMTEMFNGDLTGAAEYLMVRKDGSHFYAESNANILRDAGNNPTGILYIERDITERKKVEKVLQETNAYLENLFNYANAPIIVWDPQFRITRFNHAFEHLTGLTEKDVLGQSLEILFPSALAENSMQLIHNTLTGERWETVEIQIRHVDNSVKTVLWNSATLFASDGKTPIATIAQGQDITLRKQTEKFLKESEEKFRTVFYISPDAITLSRLSDNVIVSINKGFTDTLGYSEEDVMGKTSLQIDLWVDPKERSRLFEILKKTGKVDNFEAWFYTKRKELRYGLMSLTTLDINGEKHLINITRDITDRKQSEQVLSETNAYLENLINYANAPIIVWDPQFRITRFNHAFEHLTGLTEKDVLGQSLEILFPPELAENSMQLIYNTLLGERWETVEIQIRHNDNSVKTVLWNSATLFASDGKTPIATIAQGQDITMRKQAEEALKNSEEHFRNLFVNAPVGIFHSNWDGQFLAANPALAKILEYSNPEELILTITNMNTQIYEDPNVRSQVMDTIKKTSGWVHFDEINWRRKDNYIITVDMTGRKVFDSSGNFVYL
jgi:PAS domain S-box-containing protein